MKRADSSGLKTVLHDRLRQIMIEEGEDPDAFEFESHEFEWAKKLESKIEASSKQSESARLSLEAKIEESSNSRNLLDCHSSQKSK
ncbi:unnamed protein product, partial [Callosobruchus maculatus]